MTLRCYHLHLPVLVIKDLDEWGVRRKRREMRKEGYYGFTTVMNGEIGELAQAKMDRVMELVMEGGRIEGDLIVFPDVIYAGYGEFIKQILNKNVK
jgi:hypothetical protein